MNPPAPTPSQVPLKAVIPAAGFGTRFLPIAKAVPKEMLPLGDRPIIHYVVAEAAAAGCEEVLVILSRGKEAIAQYFTPHPELERRLEEAGKTAELATLRAVDRLARVHFVYQPALRGLGDALLCARDFVGDKSFAVLLGDTVISGESPLPQLMAAAGVDAQGRAVRSAVALEACPLERAHRYGLAGGVTESYDGIFRLQSVIEKPTPAEVPVLCGPDGQSLGPHAFAARYWFTPEIFSQLATTAPGRGGEIQLTDAMRGLLPDDGLRGVQLRGRRWDIGNPAGLIEAALAFSRI